MNLKMNLTCLLFLIGLVMFSNRAVYAQNDLIAVKASFAWNSFPMDSVNRLETKEFYLNKSKQQKTTAWILLGAGTTLTAVGLIGIGESYPIFGVADQPKYSLSVAATLIGIATDVLAVSLFIKSSKNKKRASTLSFDTQTIYSPLDKSLAGMFILL